MFQLIAKPPEYLYLFVEDPGPAIEYCRRIPSLDFANSDVLFCAQNQCGDRPKNVRPLFTELDLQVTMHLIGRGW